MELWQSITIGAAILIALAALGWWLYQRNRSQHLRERFGPEYDRRLAEHGNRRRVESELIESENRVRKLRVQPLSSSDRMRFIEEWRLCQARFVDDPSGAVDDADRLVTTIMRTRGYATDDRYDRVADVSAAYPNEAKAYRRANDIVVRHQHGNASTEDLRRAFVDLRTLFDEMLSLTAEELRRAS